MLEMGGESDAQLVSRMLSAWSARDVEALLETFDADVEIRPALSAFLSSTVYRGHEGVRGWYAETNEPWFELHAEPEKFLDAGERTLVIVALHARVPGGHVDMNTRIAHVVTVRDGKIVQLDGYEAPEDAIAAVGLEERLLRS
jgi:ketosteroid isomerase-like protein